MQNLYTIIFINKKVPCGNRGLETDLKPTKNQFIVNI